MNVWFPEFYTEAHRTDNRKIDLLDAFAKVGVRCFSDPEPHCVLAFCGSLFKAEHVRRHNPGLPVVHYNWDLYPWVVQNRKEMGWDAYLNDLRTAAAVLVPGVITDLRTTQFTGRRGRVVRPPVKVWDVPVAPIGMLTPGRYVLDVMRDYTWDAGHKYPEQACRAANLTLVRTRTRLPWDEFRWLVANAACLVSAVDEASTGGLTLLEGYAHGVPVVVSDSARNEAGRYFGDRAYYFDSTVGVDDLVEVLDDVRSAECFPIDPRVVDKRRAWVEQNFSDEVFARALKTEFERCLSCRPTC